MALRQKKNKKNSQKRFIAHKVRYIVLIIVLLVLAGGFFILRGGAFASENPWDGGAFNGYTDNAYSSSSPLYAGGDVNVPVWGRWGGHETNSDWQVVATVTSNSKYVDYLGFSCGSFSTCRPTTWYKPSYFAGENYDLRVCINVPANQSNVTRADLFTLHYRYLSPPPHNWLQVWFGTAPGSCDSNPSAAGVNVRNGYGNCSPQNYVGPGQYSEEQCNFNGPGDGTGKGIGTGFSPAPQGYGPGLSGQAPNPNPTPGPAGGGGSSAITQGDQPNSIPSSSDQGDNEQPKLEPSPFFDGKLFAAGSDAPETDSLTVSGVKLGYGWFYLGGVLTVLAVAGFLSWWKRATLKPLFRSMGRKMRLVK